ncbi:MAG: hypothetical protein LBU21_04585, partial [Treponema sp.]|nr:hypothetical protein [Treponema sp.]
PPENIVLINSRVGDANVTAGWRMIMASNQAEFDRIWRDLQTQARGLGADQSVQWNWDTYQRGKSSVQKYIDIWNNTPQLQ